MSEFCSIRDGGMTSKDSFIFRHGGSLMGNTFHVWFIYSLPQLTAEDIARFLCNAARHPLATDLQIHFAQEMTEPIDSEEEFDDPLVSFFNKTRFEPISLTIRMRDAGLGWFRVPLFSPKDLPEFTEAILSKHSE